jgi:hypothetical protein
MTLDVRALIGASALTIIVGCSGTTDDGVNPAGAPAAVPPQAANVGYTTVTFGPTLELGTNIFPFDFFGNTPVATQVTQSAPGAPIHILGPNGNVYAAGICTARLSTNSAGFTGTVFGGGYYIEAELSFTPGAVSVTSPMTGMPGFWGEDIAHLTNSAASEIPDPPAPETGYYRFAEADYMEWEGTTQGPSSDTTDSTYLMTLHDWNGTAPDYAQMVGSSSLPTYGRLSIGTASFGATNKYGALYVPATATTKGYMQAYFNGTAVGNRVEWVEYSATETLPPTLGTTAFNIFDVRQLAILFGAGINTPMTVYSLTIWQASAAKNTVISVDSN